MHFKIERDIFLKALQKVQGIVEKRTSMPILSNILLEAAGDAIEVTATDLEVGLKGRYPAKVERDGKITVGAKKLYEIVKELPNEEIAFTAKDNDWVEIICGKVRFNIVGLPSDEFPAVAVVKDEQLLELEAALLRRMIEKTSYAICNDETKYNLNGIFTRVEQTDAGQVLKMVATDGHRLSIAAGAFTGQANPELLKGVILPKKGIYEIKKITDEGDGLLQFGFVNASAVIRKGDTTLVMRLVDGEFPDYTRVIPAANDQIVKARREALIHAVRRMAILSSEKFKGIMLEIENNGIKISSSNPELGDAMEELDVTFEGAPFSVRFNARYLLDVLMVCESEQVQMKFRNELSPSIVTPDSDDDLLAVIMPMRL
ncbi:MAG: DNA polymerase III subunit beta [Geobacter sp.]|jgi:DNA polymerase-3 subunit beta|nr:DNA polymerase III subunit beta [Geobacter sp.]